MFESNKCIVSSIQTQAHGMSFHMKICEKYSEIKMRGIYRRRFVRVGAKLSKANLPEKKTEEQMIVIFFNVMPLD